MNKPWIAERTAEINASADAITALNVGDGVSVSTWTDIEAYTIIAKTKKMMVLQQDKATLLNGKDLSFLPGGFVAHCENQHIQEYAYETDRDGFVIKITLRAWADEEGNERRQWKRSGVRTFEAGGNAYAGRRKFHDYNF